VNLNASPSRRQPRITYRSRHRAPAFVPPRVLLSFRDANDRVGVGGIDKDDVGRNAGLERRERAGRRVGTA
jgi:hypothetical protein